MAVLSQGSPVPGRAQGGRRIEDATSPGWSLEALVPRRQETQRVRILVVDDDTNHLKLLASGLRLEGFEVAAAAGAEEALGHLGNGPFDVAILDVMMPGTSGLDLARRMSRDFPDVRTVLMSAYHLSERQLRLSACGAVGFIPKPYRLDELAAYLREKAQPTDRVAAAV
jgi:CheY-like chemotaxis protein